jgi:hypothetical protein
MRLQAGRLYNSVPGIATALPAIAEAPRRRVSPCRQLNASTSLRLGYGAAGGARRLQLVALKQVFERSEKIRVESAGYRRRDPIRFERYVSFD